MGHLFQSLTCHIQDMRMKFTAEDPSEVTKSGSDGVDRSQGAARAISVGAHVSSFLYFQLLNILVSHSLTQA